ncbi:MAG: hypothetical protein ACK4UT_01040 [Moraxellaceae bacterium]
MSALTDRQLAYLARRRRQIARWPYVAVLLTVLLFALYYGIYRHAPLYVDPYLLVREWEAGRVEELLLVKLAAYGHLAFVGGGLMILMLIVFASLALWNERRLLRLIAQLQATPGDDAPHE